MRPKRRTKCRKMAKNGIKKTTEAYQHEAAGRVRGQGQKSPCPIPQSSNMVKEGASDCSRTNLSSLSQEILDLVLDNIQEASTLRKLGQTCKRYHHAIKSHIQQYPHLSVDSHGHLNKLIRAIEPHLSISQKKQLRQDGQYKGQQIQFPSDVDEDEIPACASRVRQLTVGIFPTRQSHLCIAQRYIEEAFRNMRNAEIVDISSLTPFLGGRIVSMQNLKALNIFLDYGSLGRMYPLRGVTNLQHLRVVDHTFGGGLAQDDVALSMLFNSASTLRSLSLETHSWQVGNFLLGWKEMASEAGWSDQDHVHLSALKSLSLIGLRFNKSLIDSLDRIINFASLDDLVIGHVSSGALLLFPFRRGTEKDIRKLSLVMSGEGGLQPLGIDMEFEAKIRLIASFDTLICLELKEQNRHPVTIDDGTLLFDALWQAIITHKNLETLSINCTEDVGTNTIPRLPAATVTTLINNLPKLKDFKFAPDEGEMEEIGQALSCGKALVSILCCPQPGQSPTFARGPDSELITVTEILKGFLSRNLGNAERSFVWEDHYKLRRISLKHRLWDVASQFGDLRKGIKKAKTLKYEGDEGRKVMYREVPSFWEDAVATNGPGSEWLQTVTKDID